MTDSFDDRVVDLLQSGEVGLLPTDTIYGLSCRAFDREAVERVHQLKGRDDAKPFIVLIADMKMLDFLSINSRKAQALNQYWPGELSVIFQAPDSPHWLHRGTQTLAVRMPAYAELCDLIDKTGPLISTSANTQGKRPANSVESTKAYFGSQLDFYVDKGRLGNSPSTLATFDDGKLKVIRQGAVKIN